MHLNQFTLDHCVQNSSIIKSYLEANHARFVVCSDIRKLDDVIDPGAKTIYFCEDILGLEEYGFMLPANQRMNILSLVQVFTARYPDTQFTFFLPIIDIGKIGKNNYCIQPSIDVFWIDTKTDYREVTAVTTKHFGDTNFHFVFLNHNLRYHRALAVAYILGQNLESYGYISLDPALLLDHPDWNHFLRYVEFNNRIDLFRDFDSRHSDIFSLGYRKIHDQSGYRREDIHSPNNVYEQLHKTNPANFSLYLTDIYQNTCVEIIGETIFFGNIGTVTEKYLHTVYGCNFPIILNVPGTVEYLRRQGFDLFDDVVDHSYDSELNHATRLTKAIDLNKKLLANRNHAISCWHNNQQRFIKNIEHARHLEQCTQQRFDHSVKRGLVDSK